MNYGSKCVKRVQNSHFVMEKDNFNMSGVSTAYQINCCVKKNSVKDLFSLILFSFWIIQ